MCLLRSNQIQSNRNSFATPSISYRTVESVLNTDRKKIQIYSIFCVLFRKHILRFKLDHPIRKYTGSEQKIEYTVIFFLKHTYL